MRSEKSKALEEVSGGTVLVMTKPVPFVLTVLTKPSPAELWAEKSDAPQPDYMVSIKLSSRGNRFPQRLQTARLQLTRAYVFELRSHLAISPVFTCITDLPDN